MEKARAQDRIEFLIARAVVLRLQAIDIDPAASDR